MQTTIATIVSRDDEHEEIILGFGGHEALVKLDSLFVAGIDLIQDAREDDTFEIEYVMAPDTEPDAGPIIVRIIRPAS